MAKLTPSALEDVEKLMDSYGPASLLEAVEEIMQLKAEHLRENWQEESSAKVYERGARIVHSAAKKLEDLRI